MNCCSALLLALLRLSCGYPGHGAWLFRPRPRRCVCAVSVGARRDCMWLCLSAHSRCPAQHAEGEKQTALYIRWYAVQRRPLLLLDGLLRDTGCKLQVLKMLW